MSAQQYSPMDLKEILFKNIDCLLNEFLDQEEKTFEDCRGLLETFTDILSVLKASSLLCGRAHNSLDKLAAEIKCLCVDCLPLTETLVKLHLRCYAKCGICKENSFLERLDNVVSSWLKYAYLHDNRSFREIVNRFIKLIGDLLSSCEKQLPVSQLVVEECFSRDRFTNDCTNILDDPYRKILNSRYTLEVDISSHSSFEPTFIGICRIFGGLGAAFTQVLRNENSRGYRNFFDDLFLRIDKFGNVATKSSVMEMFLRTVSVELFEINANDYFVDFLLRWTISSLDVMDVDVWLIRGLELLNIKLSVELNPTSKPCAPLESIVRAISNVLEDVKPTTSPKLLQTVANLLVILMEMLTETSDLKFSVMTLICKTFSCYAVAISKAKLCSSDGWYRLMKGLMLRYLIEKRRIKLSKQPGDQSSNSDEEGENLTGARSIANGGQRRFAYRGVDFLWKHTLKLHKKAGNDCETIRRFCNLFILFCEYRLYREISNHPFTNDADEIFDMGASVHQWIVNGSHLDVLEDLFAAASAYSKLLSLYDDRAEQRTQVLNVALLPWQKFNIVPAEQVPLPQGLKNATFTPCIVDSCLCVLSYFKGDLHRERRVEILKIEVQNFSGYNVDLFVDLIPLYLNSVGADPSLFSFLLGCVNNVTARILGIMSCFAANTLEDPLWNIGNFILCNKKVKCSLCPPNKKYRSCTSYPMLNSSDQENEIVASFARHLCAKNILGEQGIHDLLQDTAPRFFIHIGISSDVVASIFDLFHCKSVCVQTAVLPVVKYLIQPFNDIPVRGYNPQMLVDRFRDAFFTCKKDKSVLCDDWGEYSIIAAIGAICDDTLLVEILVFFTIKSWDLRPVVHFIQKLAKERGVEPKDLFKRFRFSICSRLVSIQRELPNIQAADIVKSLLKSIQAFIPQNIRDARNLSVFWEDFVPEILSFIILNQSSRGIASAETHELLHILANNLSTELKKLIDRHLLHVIVALTENTTIKTIEIVMKYLASICDTGVNMMFDTKEFEIRQQLFYRLSRNREVVFGVFALMHSSQRTKSHKFDESDLKEYFLTHSRNYFLRLNSYLMSSSVQLHEKRNALDSLTYVVSILTSAQIHSIRINLNAVLCTALNYIDSSNRQYIETVMKAWEAFLNNRKDIGVEIIQVCKTLSRMLELDTGTTARILNRLVVDRRDEFAQYIPELTFLPEVPQLKPALQVVREAQIDHRANISQFRKYIDELLLQLKCENNEVKRAYLNRLKNILQQNRKNLNHLCARSKEESVDELVERVLKTLISTACIPDGDLRVKIAECIGEIGAIDPGRFEQMALQENHIWNDATSFNLDMDNFGVKLVSHLASITKSEKESRILDCVYFSIQEILKHYEIRKPNHPFFDSLIHEAKDISLQLLSSKYDYSDNWGSMKISSPVYNGKMGYKEWIFKWIFQLTSTIKDEKAKNIFSSVLAIVKYSSTTARFILPFVLVYALSTADSEDKKRIITAEVKTIIKSSIDTVASQMSSFVYPCTSPMETKVTVSAKVLSEVQHLGCQTLFSLLDTLQSLSYELNRKHKAPKNARAFKSSIDIEAVNEFLSGLSKLDLASLAYSCQSYARALMYLEEYLKKNPIYLDSRLEDLQKYYGALDDVDGVAGVMLKRKLQPSLNEIIVAHEVMGETQHVLSCCEKALKTEKDSLYFVKTQLRCWMTLDQPGTTLLYARGCINREPQWKKSLMPYMVEATLKLNNWEQLNELLNEPDLSSAETTIGVGIAKLFSFARIGNKKDFNDTLAFLRNQEMNPIAAASMETGAYIRAYHHLVRLHMLNDIEVGLQKMLVLNSESDAVSRRAEDFLESLFDRSHMVQTSLRYQEPILSLHRTLILTDEKPKKGFQIELVTSWLSSAKLARKNGNFLRAYNCLLEAETVHLEETPLSLKADIIIQKAKYHWAKCDQESKETAVRELQKGMENYFSSAVKDYLVHEDQKAAARVKLLFAKYAEGILTLNSNELFRVYKDIHSSESLAWEESYFRLAKYYHRLSKTAEKPAQKTDLMYRVIAHFGKSLRFGHKHVYESVPVMFSVWFDLGSGTIEDEALKKRKDYSELIEAYRNQCGRANETMGQFRSDLPAYIFLTVFSQLVSRICHPAGGVKKVLREIIKTVLKEYPKQAMWMLVGVYNNETNKTQAEECKKLMVEMQQSKGSSCGFASFSAEMLNLSRMLIQLANNSQYSSLSIAAMAPELLKFFSRNQVLLPFQEFMSVRFPSKLDGDPADSLAFRSLVHIAKIEDKIEVMPSLAKPKKIILVGDDGKKYAMLCKPKDDLRKDNRTMEFMNLVNRHLKRDAEARKRELFIRTYTVVPLNHECGLIEWVEGGRSLRPIIQDLYSAKNVNINAVRNSHPAPNMKDETRLKKFVDFTMKAVSPPVFNEYFLQTYKDPTSWYMARLAFTRSSAVMSIVGYIIGLGDRHLENILILEKTGHLLHVDYNIIFNKGLTLSVPEVVPFRLTHNMIDAMGATGYDGSFRKSCETTLRIMCENREALMGVLTPFVYDPLIEWQNSKKPKNTRRSKGQSDSMETLNEQALDCVKNIEDRLNGVLKFDNKPMGLPVSVSGHVSYLIEEATSNHNLSRMFVGWCPYY